MLTSQAALDHALELSKGVLFLVELDQELYHRQPHLSQSELKLIADRSPRHFLHQRKNPRPPSDEMKLGTVAHMAVLEPDKFKESVMPSIAIDKRTKAGRDEAIRLETLSRELKKTIVTQEQYDYAVAIRGEVFSHPISKEMLTNGVAERASFGRLHDLDARILTDYYRPQDHMIIDLKTTRCASMNEFERDLRKFRYHWQACWYSDLVGEITGELPRFQIIAIESSAPHCVAIFEIKFDLMAIARKEIMEAVDKLKTARVSGWDGYPLGTQEIGAHKWEWERYRKDFQDA